MTSQDAGRCRANKSTVRRTCSNASRDSSSSRDPPLDDDVTERRPRHNSGSQSKRNDFIKKLVNQKIDEYLSETKREEHFDLTTRQLISCSPQLCLKDRDVYDEATESALRWSLMEQQPARQADRMRQYADSVINGKGCRSLDAIRLSLATSPSIRPMGVHNFQLHTGSALNIADCIDYYQKHGLGRRAESSHQHGRHRHNSHRKKCKSAKGRLQQQPEQEQPYRVRFDANNRYRHHEIYRIVSPAPKYPDTNWDVAASIREQMKSFSMVEMRNHRGLRRRRDDVTPAEQVRVTIDDGDLADSFSHSCSIDARRRDSHVTDVSPRHSLCAESLDTHRLVTSSPDNGDVIADDRCSLVAMCQSFI